MEVGKAVRMTFGMLTVALPGRDDDSGGRDAVESRRRKRESVCHCVSLVDIPGASHLMNFVVLTAALSGANAALYVSSRMLFSLARSGWAPARLGKLNSLGSPKLAVLVSSFGIVVALALKSGLPGDAFVYILRAAFFGMILSWLGVTGRPCLVSPATPARNRSAPCPCVRPCGSWGSIIGFTVVWESSEGLV